ncbi:hypothetical protein [Cyanobacterium sp. Dongsha4]|uniref:hypothetical protein n=1 Tax=Cyanobacterium sp. DS4 TaxID=2878255 RepID=UPI002E80750D|nr:hypothetical protein [Cyanobacterium sp. Dongsha4]WVL00727.1 hypothetical protein Dongsha4_00580 [Cyanobacterium sp. Dongsha4]
MEYFDANVKNGQIMLTPIKVQRGDTVRKKLGKLDIGEKDIIEALAWARKTL